jgi:hypothetical protein
MVLPILLALRPGNDCEEIVRNAFLAIPWSDANARIVIEEERKGAVIRQT